MGATQTYRRVCMRTCVSSLAFIVFAGLFSTIAQAEEPEASFDLRVPVAPMVRSVDGVDELVYELHLDNFATRELKPLRVEVLDMVSARVLAVYEGRSLDQRLDLSGVQWKAETYTAIPSGRRGVVFIELSVADALPQGLRHRITYTDTRSDASPQTVEGGGTAVVNGRTRVLLAPLRGGPWVAVYDARWERGHRRVGYAIDGKLRTPGRYAVDWVKLDASGRKAPGGSGLARSAYSHGEGVLAVADGVIVHVQDQVAERSRLTESFAGALGNSMVLRLDSGEFAHYGHLRPGSATRARGARVKAGEKMAEVGFSGSASDPQLHFALTDGPIELASEGLAYVFDSYRPLGSYSDVSQVGSAPWTPAPTTKATRAAMPSSMSVVQWAR
jgi:murein DD-endopeptidase